MTDKEGPTTPPDMETIRRKVEKDEFAYVTHAIVEARKDGITPHDVEQAILTGRIIEEYPERYRCLVYGQNQDHIPIHIVVEYYDYLVDEREDILAVTIYVPSRDRWTAARVRKKRY